MKEADKSYSQLKKEQLGRESELLSQLLGSAGELKDLAAFEAVLEDIKNRVMADKPIPKNYLKLKMDELDKVMGRT